MFQEINVLIVKSLVDFAKKMMLLNVYLVKMVNICSIINALQHVHKATLEVQTTNALSVLKDVYLAQMK